MGQMGRHYSSHSSWAFSEAHTLSLKGCTQACPTSIFIVAILNDSAGCHHQIPDRSNSKQKKGGGASFALLFQKAFNPSQWVRPGEVTPGQCQYGEVVCSHHDRQEGEKVGQNQKLYPQFSASSR